MKRFALCIVASLMALVCLSGCTEVKNNGTTTLLADEVGVADDYTISIGSFTQYVISFGDLTPDSLFDYSMRVTIENTGKESIDLRKALSVKAQVNDGAYTVGKIERRYLLADGKESKGILAPGESLKVGCSLPIPVKYVKNLKNVEVTATVKASTTNTYVCTYRSSSGDVVGNALDKMQSDLKRVLYSFKVTLNL